MIATTRANSNMRSYRRFRFDVVLVLVLLALIVLGLIMVRSATYAYSFSETSATYGLPNYYFMRQLFFVVVGTAGAIILALVDYKFWTQHSFLILLLSILVLLPLFLLSTNEEIGGATRQLFDGSVQPSELSKVGFIIYVAAWLASREKAIGDLRWGFLPFIAVLGVVAFLILEQPDMSTVVILALTSVVMFYAAGGKLWQMALLIVGGGGLGLLLALTESYRSSRVWSWWYNRSNPLADVTSQGLQSAQSIIALERGGLFGVGLGQSEQKAVYYAVHTDGMFAIIGEELGLVGALFVLVLYALLIWRGLKIAANARDRSGMLLATGITCWIAIQAFVHVGVITRLIPFTGTVLPFLSYGGSSMVTGLAMMGLLLSVSLHSKREVDG